MDPYLCCLWGICCPPESAEQLTRLKTILIERGVVSTPEDAERVARFDLSLVADFKLAMIKHAKP